MNKKFLLIPAAALAITVTAAIAGVAAAQSNSSYPDLVQAIANKFHLDPSQVQQVVSDVHSQYAQKHEENLESKIAQLVKDNKLTKTQADALTAKLKDLRTQVEATKSLPEGERHTKIMQIMSDFKSWAQSQGINFSQLFPGRAWRTGLMQDGD